MPKKTDQKIDKKLQQPDNQQLIALQEQLTASQERERRVLADYQNMMRRVDAEKGQIIRFANSELLHELLPVYDHLQQAATQLGDQGLDLVVSQLRQMLSKFGVEEIEALGQKFDLETMEAIDRQGNGEVVTQVMQKGYKLKDSVLTHAKVILGDKNNLNK